ncbi:MAG TPA: MerR family transcriptional regulator [Candidatus Wallbacteria bacterium]|nr:MerR family transcriptional regulator [Candidatus Wallbacteria bacterium]
MNTYKITELGKHFGLSRSTLLYYDRIGLLRPGGRTASGYRIYTQNDMGRLERICFFREAGLELSEIGRLLEKSGNDASILENRLREIGREIMALKSRQRLIAGILRTISAEGLAPGLDGELWLSLQKACGLDEAALKKWHAEFERRAPGAHHDFLLGLGLSEKEALQVRMLTKNVEDNDMKMKYFYELFEELPRQGPGGDEATLRALGLVKGLPEKPTVLDIGCGSGKHTLVLARELKTKIMAIDNHRPVLERLKRAASQKGLAIETYEMSMLDISFDKESFDLLWVEGAIFIIGLERGLREFKTYVKPGGCLVFSEMCWFVDDPPAEIKSYFNNAYPDLRTAAEVREMISAAGYRLIESFELPDSAWWDEYYTPMLERIKKLKVKNAGVAEAEAVYAECEKEAGMFRRYSKNYGYVFFILQKV